MSHLAVLAQQQGTLAAPGGAGPDPWQWWDARTIAAVSSAPIESVVVHWPILVSSLDELGINDRAVQAATIGTVAIETASTFRPVREAYWLDDAFGYEQAEAWRRTYLRYWPFYGRGYVQLTWASNYLVYGLAIGVDLVTYPGRALEPAIAADNLARYFATHGGGPLIPEAARRGDWTEVRRLVQGGSDGLDRLVAITRALGA